MSLGRKIIALFVVLGFSLSLGSVVVLKLTVFPAFQELENESIEAVLTRVNQELHTELYTLKAKNLEYSVNDRTYEFALEAGWSQRETDLNIDHRQDSSIDLLLIFDAQGRQLYSGLQIPGASDNASVQNEFLETLGATHPLVTRNSVTDSLAGLVKTRSGIMQVVAHPILTASGQGPVAGSVVTGKYLLPERIAAIGSSMMASVTMHFAGQVRNSPETMNDAFPTEDVSEFGYKALEDIWGNTVAGLKVSTPRRIAQIGADVTRTVTLLLLALSATFLLAALLFMRRLIVVPLTRLTSRILDIRKTGNLQFEAGSNRSDEVGVLAGEFEAMTHQLSAGQEKLKQARDEALATSKAKTEFLARMSHEVRTPMNGVLGMTELLRNTHLETKQRRFTDSIYESAETLLKIINDILDFSKMDAGMMSLDYIDVHLRAIVEETMDSLAGSAHAQNVELMTMVPPALDTLVKTDPVRLRQVLANLVSNAIKFTKDGEVVVELTASEPHSGYQNVRFEVRDTGIGIKEDIQKEIFESFTQADGSITRLYGGTGLGLAICKQLIEQMGGELKVQSTPDQGSVFSFDLQLQTSRALASSSCVKMQCVAGRRVLIVDDNATNREILQRQLRSWRAHADTAASAEQAYGQIISALAGGAPYDLAILDMHMPEADGLDLARSIRENTSLKHLRLVILSSMATALTEDVLSGLDIAGQLGKPVRQAQLYDALTMVMGDKKGIRENTNLSEFQARHLTGQILVVEDNLVNQAVAKSMLEALGLEVVLAGNGLDAVEKYCAGTFNLVMMDCQLPIMDGFQATEKIRQEEAKAGMARTPIIAATANVQSADIEKCFTAGMDDFLAKPFTGEQLHAVLALYLPAPGDAVSNGAKNPASSVHSAGHESSRPDPVIDPATLTSLEQLQQPGAPNIVRKLLCLYIESSKVTKERLRNAIECSNASLVRESAHALKSSSLNVGATDLAELCKKLETMGKDSDISDEQILKDHLETEYIRVVNALRTKLLEMSA